MARKRRLQSLTPEATVEKHQKAGERCERQRLHDALSILGGVSRLPLGNDRALEESVKQAFGVSRERATETQG